MNNIVKIIIAIVVILVAWNILKGLIGLLVGVAIAGLIIYGGVKLLEGPRG
jgi:UDP-N-acetylmuramyl pentapeptide phosphotransferase/UDP-N-acetylglucosamine-1-phosphate transferase